MQLWTEYEGHRIDGAFTLEKLLLSEGRSAFFSTVNGNGAPALIRLIASHFDEEEILARWQGVEALGHANILKIDRYGQVMLDDTTMVYAIFEPVDASLADVLMVQRLTVPETKQLAISLASALDTLHKNGFVHEHIDPAKVFAVGEVVKLRGDCIRETPEGEPGLDAKKKDVHDLAVVILLALTQRETLEEGIKLAALPTPFDAIVRRGLSGAWGCEQILAALDASEPTAPASPAPRASGVPEKPKGTVAPLIEPAPVQAVSEPPAVRAKFAPPGERQPRAIQEVDRTSSFSPMWIVLIGLCIVLAFWFIWRGLHRRPAAQSAAQGSSISDSSTPSAGQPGTTATEARRSPAPKPSAATHAASVRPSATPQQNAGTGGREQWRVVAFTYNRQDQAQKKADTIAQKHANLRPEVFTPTGHAPYLVTVGGPMGRDQAFAFVQQVRKQGLPRDTYAQNYSAKRP